MKNYLLLFSIVVTFVFNVSGQVYVKNDATGANNGTSWANAYTDLQMAIDSAVEQEIWVAAGTYYPVSDELGNYSPIDQRTKTFHNNLSNLIGKFNILGGFNGSETSSSQRNPQINITILSGDLGMQEDNSDNSYHVFSVISNTNSNIIDGFQIIKGLANGVANSDQNGAGLNLLNSSLQLINCAFFDNTSLKDGGAIYCENVLFTINSCSFTNNLANNGGAIYSYLASAKIIKSTFINNHASNEAGAVFADNEKLGPDGYYHYSSSDCYQNYFENNTASVSGGALVKKNGQTATFWVNNVFKNNNAPEGSSIVVINSISFRFNFNTLVGTEVSTSNSGIYVESSYGTIYFCILWNLGSSELILNNSPSFLVLRSLVKKAPVLPSYTGYDLIIGLEPKFLNYPIDLHLSSTSPCINYEYASLADGTAISGDFDNTARGKGNAYDMGAYEFDQAQCPVISRVYIDAAANGSNMGPDWSNAFKFIEDGLNFANACPNVNEVWIAEGLYKPDIISVREHSLNVKRSLSIYGGFQGFENDIGERVLDSNYATIISGDIGMPNEVTDNTNNIFYLTDANIQVLLDGLTLQDAFNNGNNRLGGAAGMQRGKLTVQNCTFRNNTANNGGALYFSEFSNARILNCRFIGNKAVQSGGAIYSRCDSLIIFESSFYSNFAGSSGGAIYSYNSDGVEFDSLDLKYNNAAVGGGIYFGSGNGTFSKIHSLSNSAIVGGGIQFAFATIEINSSSFTSDNSNTGGAISSSSSQINLSEINFSLNKASKGVALHMLNTTILLNSCKFNLNTGSTPTTTGDLVSLNNSIFVGDDLEVFNNQNLSSITAQNSKLTLINSNIHHNQEFANSADQLFELFYTVLKFENVFVTDNQFSTNFSFLGDGSGDTVLFKNTHILRNTGNLFIVTTIEDFKLVNSVVANNLGPSYITLGSFVLGTKAAMINSVVSGNRNNTSLINLVQMYDSELMIGNCIINDNTNSGISTMNFSINAYQSIIQNGSALGPTILDVDPMFVDPASGNFNLQMGSPAINTGSPLNAPATDILGNPRPQGGFYDMGIYEYAIPTNFVFNGALDNDWHKGGNWDTGFPPPNIFNGNIIFNASATKIDGLGFDIKNPGTLTLGNGVIVQIK